MAKYNAPQMGVDPEPHELSLPVKASTSIDAGNMVGVDATGYAVPVTAATGIQVVGRAEASADNSSGSNGDIRVRVRRGVFKYTNSSGDAVAQADVFNVVYGEDATTIAKTDDTGSLSAAGVLYQVDTDGVWVYLGKTDF